MVKTIADKLMYKPNDEIPKFLFCRLKISGWNVLTLNLVNQLMEIH